MKVYVGERDVVLVSGPEAESYLQGQISQDIVSMFGENSSRWSLILQPQGKVDAWFRITKTGPESYVLDVDAGFGETLLARLKRFKLRTKVELVLETWQWHAYLDVSEPPALASPDGPFVYAASPIDAATDVLAPELPEPAGEQIGRAEYELARIRAGVPAMGSELGESTIPAEAGIVDQSVSFTKGCYTGQELVARVDSRGNNTPRKLRIITGSGLPDAGAALANDGADAGVLTSVVADGDGFAALAYVKRSSFDATMLDLDGQSVSVALVPADSPEPGAS